MLLKRYATPGYGYIFVPLHVSFGSLVYISLFNLVCNLELQPLFFVYIKYINIISRIKTILSNYT